MATKNVSTKYKMLGNTRKDRKNRKTNTRKNRKGNNMRKNRRENEVVVGGKRRATRKSRKARKGSRRAGRR